MTSIFYVASYSLPSLNVSWYCFSVSFSEVFLQANDHTGRFLYNFLVGVAALQHYLRAKLTRSLILWILGGNTTAYRDGVTISVHTWLVSL